MLEQYNIKLFLIQNFIQVNFSYNFLKFFLQKNKKISNFFIKELKKLKKNDQGPSGAVESADNCTQKNVVFVFWTQTQTHKTK